ncbi:MAG: 7-carboxy-7-deazaguanine synthase QueE [Planctomycetota bacterium]|nr:7-carboxy-7-deazaguanine synthase QueE [Planctomycetota bacterium]
MQGEGSLVGIPSVFVRTSGCNLRCRWCDTPYTSWEPTGEEMSVSSIVSKVLSFKSAKHVVLTGGEPMIATELPELTRILHEHSYHITIETAGTVDAELNADLMSISPKLANSTPDEKSGWESKHEDRRLKVEVIRSLMRRGDFQFKFVVSSAAELPEIQFLLSSLGEVPPHKVLLMPEARSIEEMTVKQEVLQELCKEHGYRYCDRLHLRLYGNTPGT